MKCFSLFSGIGGFEIALQRQGHEIVGASEIDKHARQIYSRHFPETKLWGDATKIKAEELPDFDILTAGFPCQTFSTAGKRLGFQESRGTLFFEIARIAKQKRPRYLLLENVEGLLSHDNGRTFAEILATLDEIGYDAEWKMFNSKSFIPQDRKRIYIIGHLRGEPFREILPFGECFEVPVEKESNPNVRCFTFGEKTNGMHSQMTMLMISNTNANIKQRLQDREDTWTLDTSGSYFAIKDGVRYRKLTPLECERLQGFPDDWTEGIADTHRYTCIGNAVTVPVVECVIQKIRNVTSESQL